MDKKTKAKVQKWGEADALAGKPIDAYYDTPLKRHTESLRAVYTTAWKLTKGQSWK